MSRSPCLQCSPLAPNVVPPSQQAESLCYTNICPSHNDCHIFKNNLADIEERQRNVTRAIAIKEQELVALRDENVRLGTYAETYRKITHPVRRLPDVVLREIFRACVEQAFGITTMFGVPFLQDSLNHTQPPWNISQVSHHWRVAAISFSFLWSRVALSFGHPSNDSRLGRLILQLQRSRNHPLAIYLHDLDNSNVSPGLMPPPRPQHAFSLMLVSLCTHSDRWETLHLLFNIPSPDYQTVQRMASMVKGNIPILRHLYLDYRGAYLPGFPGLIDGFAVAPELKTFSLRGADLNPSTIIRLPWGQITHFRAHSTQRGTCDSVEYISHMSRLREWEYVGAYGPPNGTPNHPQSLIFPQPRPALIYLHKLHLFPAYSCSVSPLLLETLTVPNLRILCLTADGNKIPGITPFLARVAPTLRSLCLELHNLDMTAIVGMLAAVPDLHSLHVSSACEPFVAAMGSIRTGESRMLRFVPKLRELGIFYPHRFMSSTLIRMLNQRVGSGTGDGGRQNPRLERLVYDGTGVGANSMDRATELQLHQLRSSSFEVDGTALHWSVALNM